MVSPYVVALVPLGRPIGRTVLNRSSSPSARKYRFIDVRQKSPGVVFRRLTISLSAACSAREMGNEMTTSVGLTILEQRQVNEDATRENGLSCSSWIDLL